MRWMTLFLAALAGCAHVPPSAPATADESSVAVAVYYLATCETLDHAAAAGVGFWVNRSTVATVWHFREREDPPVRFPDFAVVGSDGCREAQVADVHRDLYDLMFLRVSGKRAAEPPPLAKLTPAPGWPLVAVSAAAHGRHGALRFLRTPLVVSPLPEGLQMSANPPLFHARPALTIGDSGSPVLNDQGEIAGMFQLRFKTAPLEPYQGSFLSAHVIGQLLDACGPCED